MKGPLDGRVALVTGGGSGIGRAVSIEMARAGAFVVPVSRRREAILTLIGEIQSLGGKVIAEPMPGDVRRLDDLRTIVARLGGISGPPDILVAAAGIGRYTSVAELEPADWDEHLATNLTGTFNSVKAVLPSMLERGLGDIVTLGSVASLKVFPGCAAYAATKFGLLGFTRVLREEVRDRGVRVTMVLPGATETPIWGEKLPVPPERMIPVETVARAILDAVTADRRAVFEEILIRPALGDLG